MAEAPDPVIRLCRSSSCSKTFTYVPSREAVEKGLLDVTDRLAAHLHRFTRRDAPDEPGGVVHYCERCTRDLL